MVVWRALGRADERMQHENDIRTVRPASSKVLRPARPPSDVVLTTVMHIVQAIAIAPDALPDRHSIRPVYRMPGDSMHASTFSIPMRTMKPAAAKSGRIVARMLSMCSRCSSSPIFVCRRASAECRKAERARWCGAGNRGGPARRPSRQGAGCPGRPERVCCRALLSRGILETVV